MILSRRGLESPTQAELRESWSGSGRGYDLQDAAAALGEELVLWHPTQRANLVSALGFHLDTGAWVVVQLFSSVLQAHYAQHPPPRPGPYGALDPEPGRLHVVVFVSRSGPHFAYLDPFHEREGQPLEMSAPVLAAAFQGAVIVCS